MQLWVAAIGETNAGLVGRISARTARVLRVPVEVAADPLPLPASAYSRQRRQYLAGTLIQEAARSRRPPDTHLLAVTEADLYAPKLNFVFGQADRGLGVALISLARLREEFWGQAADPDLLLERAVKEAVHEVGHLLGLGHCSDPSCVMYFSNRLADTDRKSKEFCVRCADRVSRAAFE